MKEVYVLLREGQEPKRLPQFDVVDGYLSGPNGEVVVDSKVPGFEDARAQITEALRARLYGAIDKKYWVRPGVNPSGLRAIPAAEYDREQRDAYGQSHPGAKERERIHQMYARISGDYRYSEGADGGLYYQLKDQADAALAAWREKYPREAAEERANELEGRAAEIEDSYSDLDGSLSPADVDRLNNEREAKRQALRAQAAKIREEAGL